MSEEITIQVGFGDQMRELTVRIPDGDVRPWSPGESLAVVGKNENRLDGVAKVTGKARYTYDQNPTGLLYGKILRCPHPNANIESINLEAAKKMPGVQAVLSFPDTFRRKSVRFAWDGVAAVAASTEAQAEAALRAIEVKYTVLPFCVTKDDSMKPNAPRVGRGQQSNVERVYPRPARRRDGSLDEEREARNRSQMTANEKAVEELMAAAKHVVRGTFETQVQTHACLEPHGVVCAWEGKKLVCWASTQSTFGVRRELTARNGSVRAEDAQVLCEYIGGGFGSKFSAGREGVVCALLAKEAQKPVKLMLDRREEQTSVGNRPDSKQQLDMALDKDGKIVATRIRGWGTAGVGTRGAGAHNDAIYKIGRVDKIEQGVRTNCGSARAQRAPGWPQGLFALESMMDEAALAVGMDPIEFRKRHDSHPVRLAQYDIVAQKFDWSGKYRPPGSDKGVLRRGVGCASAQWPQKGGGGASVIVRIHRDARVEVRNGAQDIGTGTRTIMGMVAAEELGIGLADVETYIGNTDDPRGPGSGGSTTAPTMMPAVRLAAHDAKRELLAIVAAEIGAKSADLDVRGGKVVSASGGDPSRTLSFKEACALMDEDRIEVLRDRPTVERRRPNYDGLASTVAGFQCAEVEVDIETGQVRVLNVLAMQDAGKIINPKLAESQVRGAVIQGVSYALLERRVMDRLKGHMLNADLESYKILGPADCPNIEIIMHDVYMGHNNTHTMGLGEPPTVATAAAIANAVHNAIGKRVSTLPLTPRTILETLERV